MLFDLGWSEILVIGTVALIFIGPKDLPKALRVAGYWVRKARTLSREFQSGIDQMIREAELDEMRQELKKAAEFDLNREFQNTVDPTGSLAESLKPPPLPDFSPISAAPTGPALDPAPAQAAAAHPAPVQIAAVEPAGEGAPAAAAEPAPAVAAAASLPDPAIEAKPLLPAAPRPEPAGPGFAPPKP
jgi:sec-independent protein translocase protein TatB